MRFNTASLFVLVLALVFATSARSSQSSLAARSQPAVQVNPSLATMSVAPAGGATIKVRAKTGMIKDTFPPGNNGSRPGAGQIIEDGTGQKYVFQTPQDVEPAADLHAGVRVTFDNPKGNQASNVRAYKTEVVR